MKTPERIRSLSILVMGLCGAALVMTLLARLLLSCFGSALTPLAYTWAHSHEVPLVTSVSPGGTRTVEVLLDHGNATTAYTVIAWDRTEGRRIYWQYRESQAEIRWVSEDVVIINGVTLDLARGDAWDGDAAAVVTAP